MKTCIKDPRRRKRAEARGSLEAALASPAANPSRPSLTWTETLNLSPTTAEDAKVVARSVVGAPSVLLPERIVLVQLLRFLDLGARVGSMLEEVIRRMCSETRRLRLEVRARCPSPLCHRDSIDSNTLVAGSNGDAISQRRR